MATRLEKDITRETAINGEERDILITLSKDNEVLIRRKGLKNDEKNISIEDLWKLLNGEEEPKEEKVKKNKDDDYMISLYDLRTYNLISTLSYEDKVKFEAIILNIMENYPRKK